MHAPWIERTYLWNKMTMPLTKNFGTSNKQYINKLWKLRRKLALVVAALTIFTVYYIYASIDARRAMPGLIPGIIGYLVKNERCIIPDIDPYLDDAMKSFERLEYKPCSVLKPLTRVDYNTTSQRYTLKVIEDNIKLFTNADNVDCCYQSVERNVEGPNVDYKVGLSECSYFHNEIQLSPIIDSVIVKCATEGRNVYINGHAMMPERVDMRDRINNWKSKDVQNQQNATSVILIGIDSMSRLNLKRAMPKTARYLRENEWFEMSGYNKIEDNTFPNLISILTGLSFETASKRCHLPAQTLDNCSSIIWNTFHKHGYVTAFAEDEARLNIFTYVRHGFTQKPVDYYLRPFLLGIEQHLYIKKKYGQIRCIGYQDYSDYIFNYAKELVVRFKHNPYFGLFWMSSFTHEDLSEPSSMDVHIAETMRNLMELDGLDNTVVVFFSDHGIRFGPILKTLSGYYEERLPFMYVWLPSQLKKAHPEFVNALKLNKNRLTNPYDLHMTLKHVLTLSKRVTDQKLVAPAEDCPLCQSLFTPVPHNRSCDDIAIPQHYCTCVPYQNELKNSTAVLKLAQLTIDYINHKVATFQNGALANMCEHLSLSTVDTAYRALNAGTETDEFYRINFYTAPNQGLFGATVRYHEFKGDFEVIDKISRLNLYHNDSYCIPEGDISKFCACHRT